MRSQAHHEMPLPRLMLVTDRHVTHGRDLVDVVAAACESGLRFVQVRERDLPADVLTDLVLDIRNAVSADVLIVVNGRAEVAQAAGCGLHLPAAAPDPEPPVPQPWGRAVHNETETARALAGGARYLVVGTIFPTPSKPNYPGAGLGLVEKIARAAGEVPVFAIGGIDAERAPSVRRAGAHGVAVRRAVLEARHPGAAVRHLIEALSI